MRSRCTSGFPCGNWIALTGVLLGTGLLPGASCPAQAAASRIDFNRDIQPILSDNCFACHGPDDKARKAGLRFDQKDEALKPAESGDRAIVPGDPEHSSLVARITTRDEDDLMPPPKSGKKLNADQIEKLRAWIAEGAPWKGHWAFETPRRPEAPPVKNNRWVRNEIDRFVLARLEREGLKPSPEADKATQVRRATLDLTGLPPSIEEVDAYLADTSPGAYQQLVDRLLESPRYGEHMAKYWLDAARYADSHGYHIDAQRDIWAYRDWVVEAFNANKRFDVFSTEQIAGDLLPEPTLEQKIGSGFMRCNMSTGEGGAIEAEYAAKYAFDRVETAGTIWMGLTLVCARCHTHKYDPIQHSEYYGLYAFFNNLDEPVMDDNKPNPDPYMKLPSEEQRERMDRLKKQLADGQARIESPVPELDQAQAEWAGRWHKKLDPHWEPLQPIATRFVVGTGRIETPFGSTRLEPTPLKPGTNPRFQVLGDHSIRADLSGSQPEAYELQFHPGAVRLAGLRLEALPPEDPGDAPVALRLSEFEAELKLPAASGGSPETRKLKFPLALADASEGDNRIDRANDGNRQTAWRLDAASMKAPRSALFILDEPIDLPDGSELAVTIRFGGAAEKQPLQRFRVSAAAGAPLAEALNPPRLAPWRMIGPFKSDGLKEGLEKVYPPEETIDYEKSYPGVREEIRWAERTDLADGRSHLVVNELHGVHGVYYFHRTLRLSAPETVEFSVVADDVFKVWVNDRIAFQRADPDMDRGVSSRFKVELEPGENRILIKAVNLQGAKKFAFDKTFSDPDLLPRDIAAILSTRPRAEGDWGVRTRNYYRRQFSEEFKTLFANVEQWREAESTLEKEIPTTLVAKESPKMRETHVLMRGEYDKLSEKVSPGVPAVLPPFPVDAPLNRLGLAQWLMSPTNPLTARVTVNRFWQQYFGVGLVKTVEDFGVQGELPSHPALLDWLATEFVRSGWDVKHLQRLIVTSATYRQTSKADPEERARDPENRLLARGPRFRVDAEVLRDTALSIGGLLREAQGGRSVRPYEPPGLWEAVSFNNSQKYVPDTGDALHRRSLYTHWKRQSPPPNMLIFDAPTREYCVARRPRTNTPLQALALLNDPQFIEASRSFAERILREGGQSVESRLAYAFRLATARKPARDETRVLLSVFEHQLAAFRENPEAAQKLLEAADAAEISGLDASELAAWTTVASVILNLDETVTKG